MKGSSVDEIPLWHALHNYSHHPSVMTRKHPQAPLGHLLTLQDLHNKKTNEGLMNCAKFWYHKRCHGFIQKWSNVFSVSLIWRNMLPTNQILSTPTTSLYYSESSPFWNATWVFLTSYQRGNSNQVPQPLCHMYKGHSGFGPVHPYSRYCRRGYEDGGSFSQHRSHLLRSHPYIGDICYKCWGSWNGLQPIGCRKWHLIWVARCLRQEK